MGVCDNPLQWQHLLLGTRDTMRAIRMWLVGMLMGMGTSLDLGYGGLPGQRSPRTGSVWPPYPGANQGYWARQAGFYNTLPNFSTNKTQQTFSPTTKLYN